MELEHGWDAEVPLDPELGFHSIADAVGKLAKASQGKEQETLQWLTRLLHMTFLNGGHDGEGDHYSPFMVMGGRRSMEEADLKEPEEAEKLIAAAERATNPWIQHRLGDLAWRMMRRGAVPRHLRQAAVEAGKAAARSALELDADNVKVGAQNLLLRAASIAKESGDEPLHREVRDYCEKLLARAGTPGAKRPRTWMADTAQKGLERLGVEQKERPAIAKILVRIAERYRAEDEPDAWTEGMWEAAHRWAERGRDAKLAKECKWGWGQEIVRWAEAEHQGSALALTIFYGRAIPLLEEGVKGEDSERRRVVLQEIKHKQHGCAERVAQGEGLTTIEVPYPEGMRETAAELRESLRGQPLNRVMTTLALLTAKPKSRDFYTEAAAPLEEAIFGRMTTRVSMDDGRILPEREKSNDGMTENEMASFDLYSDPIVKGRLAPCLAALREEHQEEAIKKWLAGICQCSAWVPPEQMGSWVEGLLAGIRGDWKHSLDVLLPRAEGALRHVNNKRGLGELKGHGRGERDLMLRDLLEPERCSKLVSAEWRNDLLATIGDRYGWNLRNNHCHGKMEDAAYGSEKACYFWWQMLHFTASAALIPAPPLATPDDSELAKHTPARGQDRRTE